ncbi:hypothetical protein Tco_0487696 [Tanacetum coccineum]
MLKSVNIRVGEFIGFVSINDEPKFRKVEDETPELINEFQNVDKHVPTIFDRKRIEATLRDMFSNQFRDAEEYAYHLYRNTEEKRYVISLYKIHVVPFPEEDLEEKINRWEQNFMMRENDKLDSFSEADFKYLNKNDIETIFHDFQLGIESYQIKINLTEPTLIFPGIEASDPYSIVDEPRLGLIFLNNKEEKKVMDLVEIVKFCDATLERVLKEVKLKIFETKFLKKASLLGDLDLKIMKSIKESTTIKTS